MKAGLMRVNYDPRYTHQPSSAKTAHKPYEPLNNRITLAKEIYKRIGSDKKPLRDSLEEAARKKVKQHEQSRGMSESVMFGKTKTPVQNEPFEKSKRKSAGSTEFNFREGYASANRNDDPLRKRILSTESSVRDEKENTIPERLKLEPIKTASVPATPAKWRYTEGSGAVSTLSHTDHGINSERKEKVDFFLPDIDPTTQVIERVKKAYQQNSNFQVFKSPMNKAPPRTANCVTQSSELHKKGYMNLDLSSNLCSDDDDDKTLTDRSERKRIKKATKDDDIASSVQISSVSPQGMYDFDMKPPDARRRNIVKLESISQHISPRKEIDFKLSSLSNTPRASSITPRKNLSSITRENTIKAVMELRKANMKKSSSCLDIPKNFDKRLDNAFYPMSTKRDRKSYRAALLPLNSNKNGNEHASVDASADKPKGASVSRSAQTQRKPRSSVFRSASMDTLTLKTGRTSRKSSSKADSARSSSHRNKVRLQTIDYSAKIERHKTFHLKPLSRANSTQGVDEDTKTVSSSARAKDNNRIPRPFRRFASSDSMHKFGMRNRPRRMKTNAFEKTAMSTEKSKQQPAAESDQANDLDALLAVNQQIKNDSLNIKKAQKPKSFTPRPRIKRSATSQNIWGGQNDLYGYYRSRTVPPADHHNGMFRGIKNSTTLEMERKAKVEAERAAKNKKVFTIIGPYPSLRQALRKRGWVEKFLNAPPPGEFIQQNKKKPPANNPDDPDYDGTAELKVKPWEEENGYYGMMSYVLRNSTPSFVFTVRSVAVDSRIMKNGQIVNHFGKSKNITTKVGLCQNLRHVYWYDKVDPDTFYPRCYKMDEEDERNSFIEDYRRSACISFVQHFVEKYEEQYRNGKGQAGSKSNVSKAEKPVDSSKGNETNASENHGKVTKEASAAKGVLKMQTTVSERSTTDIYGEMPLPKGTKRPISKQGSEAKLSVQNNPPVPYKKGVRGGLVSSRSLEVAYEQCLKYIRSKTHEDIDISASKDSLTEAQWDQFITWFYQFVQDGGEVKDISQSLYDQCKECVQEIGDLDIQSSINGVRNAWILKPGAKSRGRGIQVADKLGICLQQAESDGGAMVIQKYIERPFCVYNTKFDIRQWFLVTDYNPLTVWFYKDCYLRFCSQEYTLDDFSVVIHLSNNSVQKHHKVDPTRSDKLPDDNMWTSDEFAQWLNQEGHGDVWAEKCVPGMKKSILCSLLCTQEYMECRKNAFELYGADFMITPDFQPWLLEINSSPSMARNTRATIKLVDAVLEDTCKVVLDRKQDKTADIGRFELLHAQRYVQDPPPIDMSLSISGRKVKKPATSSKNKRVDR